MRKLLFAALLLAPLSLFAQGSQDVKYQLPPQALVDVVDAPLTPFAVPSPDGATLLMIQAPPLLTIADLSQAELKLAGVRFNPETHDQTRSTYYTSLALQPVAGSTARAVSGVPSGARMRYATWSPDSSKVAFTVSTPNGVELWVAEAATGAARRAGSVVVNQSLPRRPYEWMPDSKSLVARTVPATNSNVPDAPRTPTGPAVQESRARKAAARTYEDMIRNESDAALFEHHMQSELVRVPLDGSAAKTLAASAMILRGAPSPDGRFLIIETAHRPFSYTVPVDRFPRRVDIASADGKVVRQLVDLPLADNIPIDFDAVRPGPRFVDWRADKPATLFWVEALDNGNPRVEVPNRDRLLTLAEPFSGDGAKLVDLPLRYDGIKWGTDDLALVYGGRFKDRKTQTWWIKPGTPSAAPQVVWDRSAEDRYSDPGDPVTTKNASGQEVLLVKAPHNIFLMGDGASPEGLRPFVDRLDLDAKKSARLWRAEGAVYEEPVDLRGDVLVTRRESVTEPPNWFARDLKKKTAPRAITSYPTPTPQLAGVSKEIIRYKRADGLELNGTLYLPPGYDAKKDGALPVLMWAYPQEFKSASAASQITTSPYRFTRMGAGSPIIFVLRGYAVLDNPTIPIIGEGSHEPNDTYVEQLVAGAQAAVDELVRRGVGDRDRMAISGHSYGAFMTANLLAHSDLFRAGIARSGAYNRTLTPFSFQSEERNYWQAPDVYTKMSPFTYADKINEPILLIHGMEDDNTGTFPIQSERLYAALSGLGGTTRLVMLPKEAHGYRARESVLHVLWEMDQWLERYVKNAPKR